MEILNDLPEEKYVEVDEFLAYIGIYEDAERLNRYSQWLERLHGQIHGRVVVEAGAGFGVLTRELLKHHPAKLYAVESNPLTFKVLSSRFSEHPEVKLVNSPIEDFLPAEPVDLLVHEFYGSMLYDENLFSLENLKFRPRIVFPDGGELRAAVVPLDKLQDEVVDESVFESLAGVIVGDLFPDHPLVNEDFDIVVARYRFGEGISSFDVDISGRDGELLAFAVFLTHNGSILCSAVDCENWMIGWTPRVGDRLRIDYRVEDGFSKTVFRWK